MMDNEWNVQPQTYMKVSIDGVRRWLILDVSMRQIGKSNSVIETPKCCGFVIVRL